MDVTLCIKEGNPSGVQTEGRQWSVSQHLFIDTTMNSAIIAFLTCLLVCYVQGQSDHSSNKCKCLNGYVGQINTKLIKGVPVVHHPSIFCLQTEIIITTTADKKKCVNPQSPLGKTILKNMNKHRNNGAVSQTNTQSSTSLHTTSMM